MHLKRQCSLKGISLWHSFCISNLDKFALVNKTYPYFVYLPFQWSQTYCFSILCFVSQPQSAGYMLHKTNGITILYFRNSHAINITLMSRIQFFLCPIECKRENNSTISAAFITKLEIKNNP